MDSRKEKRGRREGTETRSEILRLLKLEGTLDAEGLAQRLDITAVAVRQHLAALAAEGYVEDEEVVLGRGRPLKRWSLTERSLAFFPDSHTELLGELLICIPKVFGAEGLERLLEERTRLQERDYLAKLGGAGTLLERLERLVEVRNEEGYMAHLEPSADGDGWLLIQNHCSICAAARECESLCNHEQDLFARVLGPSASVSRQEHLLSGGRRCVYQVVEHEHAREELPSATESEADELTKSFLELERRYRIFMGEEDSARVKT